MREPKPRKTPEELSRIRSEAGRKGAQALKASGNFRGGRKKGWTKDPSLKSIPNRTMSVRDPDYRVFVRCASAANVPLVEFMHMNAEGLKKRNPQIFDKPSAPVEP